MVFKTRVCWLVVAASATQAFQSPTKNEIPLRRTFTKIRKTTGDDDESRNSNPFSFVSSFFTELDNFVDDATARRLGGGAKFYGKRKSSFYGSDDTMKKSSRAPDPTEDYQGPTNTGYFVWKKDEETGRVVPKTRMKDKTIERNPSFWDKAFGAEEE